MLSPRREARANVPASMECASVGLFTGPFARMSRGLQRVQEVVPEPTIDEIIEEPVSAKRRRFIDTKQALAAAATLGLLSTPQTSEEQVILAHENAALWAAFEAVLATLHQTDARSWSVAQ